MKKAETSLVMRTSASDVSSRDRFGWPGSPVTFPIDRIQRRARRRSFVIGLIVGLVVGAVVTVGGLGIAAMQDQEQAALSLSQTPPAPAAAVQRNAT